jgi:cytochrome c oxidase subunit II
MKNVLFPVLLLACVVVALAAFMAPVYAAPAYEGIAKDWQLGFQDPATPVMEKLDSMHDFLLVVITAITVFVLLALIYICVRFRRKANPNPSKTTHNTKLEVIWTVIPIIILVVIAIPSLRIHYFMNKVVEPELTLKVVGYQWYWHYEYPDQGGFGFDSYMKKDEDLQAGDHRLLAVDNRVVVPVNTKVRVLLTGADVIHAWAVPAFGVKRDAIPGRLNETWFEATRTGRFYGQCSELCGVGHGFMPIVVDVVSKEEFAAWVAAKQKEAGIDPASLTAEGEAEDAEAVDANAEGDAKAAETGVPDEQAKEEKPQDKSPEATKQDVKTDAVTSEDAVADEKAKAPEETKVPEDAEEDAEEDAAHE